MLVRQWAITGEAERGAVVEWTTMAMAGKAQWLKRKYCKVRHNRIEITTINSYSQQ